MPKGQLTINKKDAYEEWGISMDSSALSTLMTPAPIKSLIENDSRLEHGKEMITSITKKNSNGDSVEVNTIKVDSRDITLTFNIRSKDETGFLEQYAKFCKVLENGKLDIETSFQKGVIYHMIYQSCQQFSEFRLGLGKFVLKLTEPNPKNRN